MRQLRRTRPPAFHVLPAQPEYVLQAPDASRTYFGEILGRYAGSASGWVDMRPLKGLHIENAYFQEGAAEQNIRSYLGTESVRYRARADGTLAESGIGAPLASRPASQPPARTFLAEAQRTLTHHRFYFQVLVNPTDDRRAAVLLSAATSEALAQLSLDPAATCREKPQSCTVFPSSCSASLEMDVFVDGETRNVAWGTRLASIAQSGVSLSRLGNGGYARVHLDSADPEALRIPLLPGDRILIEKP